MQIISERGATRKSVIDALIDDKLKLQAAKRLGIEITDEEVVKSLIVDRLADGEEPDVNAYYAPRVAYGIGRKTIQEMIQSPARMALCDEPHLRAAKSLGKKRRVRKLFARLS